MVDPQSRVYLNFKKDWKISLVTSKSSVKNNTALDKTGCTVIRLMVACNNRFKKLFFCNYSAYFSYSAMNKNDIILIIIATLLAAAMILTFFMGGEKSRHGVGLHQIIKSVHACAAKTTSRPLFS